MEGSNVFSIAQLTVMMLNLGLILLLVFLLILIIKALLKYLKKQNGAAKSPAGSLLSMGDRIRQQRLKCGMTQEFVAERLGVSRQAVSKWEKGLSDPSTANLIALAQLFKIPAELLLGAPDP